MNVPTLPTDNLYKFIALAGLVLFVSAVVVGARQLDVLDQISAREFDLILSEAAFFDAQWDSVLAELRDQDDRLEKLQERMEKMENRLDGQYDAGVTKTRLRADRTIAVRWLIAMSVLAVVGTLVTAIGFYLWYTRLQRFQDALVIANAESRRGS